jgi:mannose-6-phosphate isomerase
VSIHRLHNRVQHYAWGSPAAIPELVGRSNPDGKPWAELWMGVHPQGPSTVELDTGERPLSEWIASDPQKILGPSVAARFDGKLPFLFKLLAAERPLSIQAHPDAAGAREGFERENRDGVPLDAPARNYRDPSHKSEIICALSEFRALSGFRRIDEMLDLLGAVEGPALKPLLDPFRARPDSDGLRAFFGELLRLDGEQKRQVVEQALEAAAGRVGERKGFRWLCRLGETYPGDSGVLTALMLNSVRLEPGEALFLDARHLHAYIRGFGVELMASSDNVLRGGLTQKHVDLAELQRVVAFEPLTVDVLRPSPRVRGESVYRTPAPEFELGVIELEPAREHRVDTVRSIEILLCVDGRASIDDGSGSLRFDRGESVVVAAASPGYTLTGRGRIYRAAVPRA